MNRPRWILVIFLLSIIALPLENCGPGTSNSSGADPSTSAPTKPANATPISPRTTTIAPTGGGSGSTQYDIGTMTIYIYQGQQLSMSYDTSAGVSTKLRVVLPNSTSLTYFHTPDSPVVGQLSNSQQTAAITGRFVYQCTVTGFHTFEFTTPHQQPTTIRNPDGSFSVNAKPQPKITVSYETR